MKALAVGGKGEGIGDGEGAAHKSSSLERNQKPARDSWEDWKDRQQNAFGT